MCGIHHRLAPTSSLSLAELHTRLREAEMLGSVPEPCPPYPHLWWLILSVH